MYTASLVRPARFLLAATTSILLSAAAYGAPAVIDTAVNPANGHVYYLLETSDWTAAENAAVALGGHLATIRNLDENNWLWDRWGTNRNLWIGLSDPVVGDGGGAEHAANFVWASAETSAYRNWNPGEPNGDAYAFIFAKETGRDGQWNDADATDSGRVAGQPLPSGVVEVLTCTPHHATATAILSNGFVVGTQINDAGCGYTSAPLVSIQGGGGSGATATATINTNGMVTAITIINAGSGYASAPQILIASPPFVPTVSIGYSKVKVTANVMLGLNYVLESSTNLVNWSAAGAAFTATNEYMAGEFDVELTGRYFRIRQVP